jgi:hypothetical protein
VVGPTDTLCTYVLLYIFCFFMTVMFWHPAFLCLM